MKMRTKALANIAAVTGLAWLVIAPGLARAQGQTWVGGNLQKMVEAARWRLGVLRVNAAFRLARTGYDSDIYYGFLIDPTPDVTSSASTPVQVLLPLSKKAVVDVSDSPEYVFYLDNRGQRTWNNTFYGRVHVALDKIYIQAGGGLSNVRRRLSPELDLHIRQKALNLSGLLLWQASKSTSLALLYNGAQFHLEDVNFEGVSLADRLNRNEEYLDLIAYVQPSARVRLSLDGQYGSYQFQGSEGALRDSTSYALFAGAEFIPAEGDLEIVRGLVGAVTIGYMRIDMRNPQFKDGSGLMGEASVSARLSSRMTGQITFSRDFQFSIYSGGSYYLSTSAGAGITRLLSRRVSLSYDFTYGQTSYPGSDSISQPHYYRYLTHALSLNLRLARHLGATFFGTFGQRERGASLPVRDRYFAGLSLVYGFVGSGMSAPARGGRR